MGWMFTDLRSWGFRQFLTFIFGSGALTAAIVALWGWAVGADSPMETASRLGVTAAAFFAFLTVAIMAGLAIRDGRAGRAEVDAEAPAQRMESEQTIGDRVVTAVAMGAGLHSLTLTTRPAVEQTLEIGESHPVEREREAEEAASRRELADQPIARNVTLVVDHPLQPATEVGLAWWHVEVRASGAPDDRPARVFLRLELPNGRLIRELQLMWPTPTGPVDEIVMGPREPERHVPVAARCMFEAMLSGAPGRLPHFPLPAGVARITDRRALMGGADGFTDLAPPFARFRLVVRVGGNETVSPVYLLTVPPSTAPNSEFRLIQLLEEPIAQPS